MLRDEAGLNVVQGVKGKLDVQITSTQGTPNYTVLIGDPVAAGGTPVESTGCAFLVQTYRYITLKDETATAMVGQGGVKAYSEPGHNYLGSTGETTQTLSNSRCAIKIASSQAQVIPGASSNVARLIADIEFLPGFTGSKRIYVARAGSSWYTDAGSTFSFTIPSTNHPPTLDFIEPSTSGVGTGMVSAKVRARDADGVTNIQTVDFSFRQNAVLRCQLRYTRATGSFQLVNGTACQLGTPEPSASAPGDALDVQAKIALNPGSWSYSVSVTDNAGAVVTSSAISIDNPGFSISLGQSAVTVVPGQPSVSVPVTVTAFGGFSGAVTITPGALPGSASAPAIVLSSSGYSGNLVFSASIPSTGHAAVPVTITGSSAGFANATSTLNITIPVYVITSNPVGRKISVDGQTITTPVTMYWRPGDPHNLNAAPETIDTTTRFVHAGWSDGGPENNNVTAPNAPTTYVATRTKQHYVTATVAPAGAGTIYPTSGWYTAGTVLSLGGTPLPFYVFSNFTVESGAGPAFVNPTTNPQNYPVDNERRSIVANFTRLPVTVSVSPASATKGPNQTQQFSATVNNSNQTEIEWSMVSGVGTFSATGLYTAPLSISFQQTATVKAAQKVDTTKFATATVTLNPPNPPTVSMPGLPGSSTLGFRTFQIQGTANPGRIKTLEFSSYDQSMSTLKCKFKYDQSTNVLSIAGMQYDWNDNPIGIGWIGSGTLGSSNTLSGQQCSVNLASSSVAISGDVLTLNVNLYLPLGQNFLYVFGSDYSNFNSALTYMGNHIVNP